MNYWIWLSQIKGIGPIKKKELLREFKTPKKIYNASREELLKIKGITERIAYNIEQSKDTELIKKYEAYINKNNIKIVNIIDKEYPENLRQIYDPPITLFCIGDFSLLKEKSIGIVGTREPSSYGKIMAKKFAEELCENRSCNC